MIHNSDGPVYSTLTGTKGGFQLYYDENGEGNGACIDLSLNSPMSGPGITVYGYYATASACCSACSSLHFPGGCTGECN